MTLPDLRAQTQAAEPGGRMGRDLLRWLGLLVEQIRTNVTNIATNVTNIATNVTNIAANTAAIANKQDRLQTTGTKTTNYTASAWDFVPVDTTSNDVTVSLPAAASGNAGDMVAVKHVTASNSCLVDVTGGGTIDGATSVNLLHLESLVFLSDGSVWWVT